MMLFRATTAALLVLFGIATISNADDNVVENTTVDRIFGRRLSSNERKRIGTSSSTKHRNGGLVVSRDTTNDHLRSSVIKQQQYRHHTRRRLTEVVDEEENDSTHISPSSSSSNQHATSKARRNMQYIPGDDPTQDDDLIWDPSYRYPEFEAIIVSETELSLSMQLSLSPTLLSPIVTSPPPTPCEYRKWYLSYTKRELTDDDGGDAMMMGATIMVCTNGEYSSSIIGSMIYYDSVDDCCAQNIMLDDNEESSDECMKIDVCNLN
jgi:hypothetical protein